MDKLNTVMMETAMLWSKESYSTRNKVGAVLSKKGRILVTGYNGTIQNSSNVCEIIDKDGELEIDCPDCYKNSHDIIDKQYNQVCETCHGTGKVRIQNTTNEFVLHAEQNVICFAARNGISTDGCSIYVTLSPCKNCAKLIAQSGIIKVFYESKYRDTSGIDFLQECGIPCIQHKIKKDDK